MFLVTGLASSWAGDQGGQRGRTRSRGRPPQQRVRRPQRRGSEHRGGNRRTIGFWACREERRARWEQTGTRGTDGHAGNRQGKTGRFVDSVTPGSATAC